MRFLCCLILLFILFIAAGCLVGERTQYTLTLNNDGKSGTFTTIMRNIESDSRDPSSQRKDFNELIANWKSDRYLLDQMDKGLYVKQRSLMLDNGKLTWKETALFSDVTKLIPGFNTSDTMKFPISDTAGQQMTTNGRVVTMRDSMFIVWPPHTKKFEFTSGRKEFKPTSAFAERFGAYQKKR